jgi:hypothetical protein
MGIASQIGSTPRRTDVSRQKPLLFLTSQWQKHQCRLQELIGPSEFTGLPLQALQFLPLIGGESGPLGLPNQCPESLRPAADLLGYRTNRRLLRRLGLQLLINQSDGSLVNRPGESLSIVRIPILSEGLVLGKRLAIQPGLLAQSRPSLGRGEYT